MRRVLVSAAMCMLAACAIYRGPEQDNLAFTAPVTVDSALRLAATQLQLHGYTVTRQAANVVVTRPRIIPSELRNPQRDRAATFWVLRVEITTSLANEARFRVSGYVVPDTRPAEGQVLTRTTPVTAADGQLFDEVEAVAGWIRDAAQRATGITSR
ncbi:MAG TPA: hypothetical protein VJ812_06600 [Gemmatimonadaceae bacterium]|jgi:hypothetical protein|nr:hypothetical protein [Gemmatimonadaceae bacterium]